MFSIFGIVAFAVFVGVGLAIFATRRRPPGSASLVPPEDDAANDSQLPELRTDKIFALAEKLAKENELYIKDRLINSEREIYWIGESTNDFYFGNYVIGFLFVDPENPYILMSDVLEFKDFIKSVQSSKGFLFTNGYFTRDVHQPLEGAKVTLYNKRKILDELKRFQLS